MIFSTDNLYYLASRYAGCITNSADFGLHIIDKSRINGAYMFVSTGYTNAINYYIRPVVNIDLNIINKCGGENSSTNMHTINKK